MPNSALFGVLANAILSADAGTMAERISETLGRDWRWIAPLCGRYLERFPGLMRPRRRQVIAFLHQDQGFLEACRKHGRQIRVAHWTTPSPAMQPVAAARGWAIPPIETVGALAQWCGCTPSELAWFADLKGLNSQPWLDHYHYRFLAKSNGDLRLIESPKARLKALQRKVLSGILDRIPPHPAVHGFVPERSVRTFAAPHAGKRVVLRMDLADFFPSVSGARVQGLFRAAGYPETVADLLGGIVTNAVAKRVWAVPAGFEVRALYAKPHLPQGAPTSPALANLVSYRFDCRLAGLAAAGGAVYTRYADDLAFSGGEVFLRSVEEFAVRVAAIVSEEGFRVNHRKTRIMRQSVRQGLGGLVVNQRLNVKRGEFDLLKAVLTNCVRHGAAGQNRDGVENFREHLAGRVSYVASIHAGKGSRLRALFDQVEWGIR